MLIVIQVFLRFFNDVIMPPVYTHMALALLLLCPCDAPHHVQVAKMLPISALVLAFHEWLSRMAVALNYLCPIMMITIGFFRVGKLI